METTREHAKENIHKNLVHNLQSLLKKNYDAEKGFKKAVEDAKSKHLKEYLKHQAVKRNRFATEIDNELRSLNEKPKESGSAAGTLHRTWMDIKSAVSGNNDQAVLEECIRGDKASVEEYEETLQKNNFPPKISSVLNNQLSDIKSTLSKVKTFEDLAEEWK